MIMLTFKELQTVDHISTWSSYDDVTSHVLLLAESVGVGVAN